MSFFARQRYKPGIKGYSPRPLTPEEARVISNLEMERDGTWRARPGLLTRVTYGSTVRHVSQRPGVGSTMVVAGGTLYLVAGGSWASTSKDTGWPTTGRIKSTVGINTAGNRLWVGADGAAVCTVDGSGTFTSVSGSPISNWVESYGQYVLSCNTSGEKIRWCEAGDVTDWAASNEISALPSLGNLLAIVALSESQALLIGTDGVGMLQGNEEGIFSQGEVVAHPFGANRSAVCKAGNRAAVLGPDARLYLYGPDLSRVDAPVHDDLQAFGAPANCSMWFDPVLNCVCISHDSAAKTWLFDLERGAWAGTWDKALVGMSHYITDAYPYRIRLFGYGVRLSELEPSTYQDAGSDYTCALETVLPSVSAPESEKMCSQLHVDGVGNWTVKLYGRDNPDGSFALLDTRTVEGPGWVYFANHTYREGMVRFEATASSTLRFRSFQADERAVGVAA